MTYLNIGAIKRHIFSQRHLAAGNDSMAGALVPAATLSTLELRQLVAAMVD